MKAFMILSLFALSVTISQVSQAVVITSIEVEKTVELEGDHYICLGDGWDKEHYLVTSKIKDLKTVFPNLFRDLGEKEKNCFSPSQSPASTHKELDSILALIDEGSGDKLQVMVGESGSPVLANLAFQVEHKGKVKPGIGNAPGLLRNQNATFLKKIGRAQFLVGGVEAAGMGILIALPHSVSKWQDDWMAHSVWSLKRAWTSAPVMDHDKWQINYIGHPYAGAIYYNLMRSQGASRLQSLLFSTFQSSFWEFGIEAIAERPSIQDLIVTPLVGSFVGELAHMGTMKMREHGFNLAEKVLVTIIDPSYVLNNGYK